MTSAGEWERRRRRASPNLALVAIVILSGFLVLTTSSSTAAAATPRVTILSPLDGSVVGNGTAVTVQLLVSNFTLVQPGRVGQTASPGEGHANVSVDGQLVRLVTDVEPFPLAVTSGPHTIRVELVADDGTPLSPEASDAVRIVATRGPATGVPTLAVLSPKPEASTGHGFWVTMAITNFTLVGAHGQPNAPNEGHIQVLVVGDVVEELTTYAPVILVAMPDGDIALTVRLVNNDNSPLSPDVFVGITVHVAASSSVSLPLILNGGVTLLLGFTLVVLIIRRRHFRARGANAPGRNS